MKGQNQLKNSMQPTTVTTVGLSLLIILFTTIAACSNSETAPSQNPNGQSIDNAKCAAATSNLHNTPDTANIGNLVATEVTVCCPLGKNTHNSNSNCNGNGNRNYPLTSTSGSNYSDYGDNSTGTGNTSGKNQSNGNNQGNPGSYPDNGHAIPNGSYPGNYSAPIARNGNNNWGNGNGGGYGHFGP